MGTLSTKIDTPRHEEVTIPNAVLISDRDQLLASRRNHWGVLVYTSVTIGYDAPWRQVEALLLLGCSSNRRGPTGSGSERQTALDDSYVRYALLLCLEVPQLRGAVLAELHANIQDAFKRAWRADDVAELRGRRRRIEERAEGAVVLRAHC